MMGTRSDPICFPSPVAPRDPIAFPWMGDVWQKGPRARRLLGLYRRVPCPPYKSYGRILTHHMAVVDDLADATHVEIQRLLCIHAPNQTAPARRNLATRPIGGVPFKGTSESKIPLSAWLKWLQGATLIEHGPDPDPPAPPRLSRRLGVLLEQTEGDKTTWTFEWGMIVRTRDETYPRFWEGAVLVGGVPVGTWQGFRREEVLDVCWGYAQGVLTAVQSLSASTHAMIRLGLEDRTVVAPDFRRDP